MRRILVTGSRTWVDTEQINDTFLGLAEYWPSLDHWVVVHGAAGGVDTMARDWAIEHAVEHEPHPATWRVDGVYRPSAGFDRNLEMVEAGADICIAWIDVCHKAECARQRHHGSHGAVHCATAALRSGIPVWWIRRGWS